MINKRNGCKSNENGGRMDIMCRNPIMSENPKLEHEEQTELSGTY